MKSPQDTPETTCEHAHYGERCLIKICSNYRYGKRASVADSAPPKKCPECQFEPDRYGENHSQACSKWKQIDYLPTTPPVEDREVICLECWAHNINSETHVCPPLMKELVTRYNSTRSTTKESVQQDDTGDTVEIKGEEKSGDK